MAKFTRLPSPGPDDPMFSQGPQIFVPASRPSMTPSQPSTAGTPPNQEEQDEQESMAALVAKALAALPSRANSTSSAPAIPGTKDADGSKVLSELMNDNLAKTTTLQEKQRHLIELLKSDTNSELRDELISLMRGPKEK